jgi:hypothetical protein
MLTTWVELREVMLIVYSNGMAQWIDANCDSQGFESVRERLALIEQRVTISLGGNLNQMAAYRSHTQYKSS